MSSYSYFSNQTQRYSAAAVGNSSSGGSQVVPLPNGASSGGSSGDPSIRPARTPSVSSWSRLSLSVANDKDGNGLLGGSAGTEGARSVHPLRSTWVFWYRQQRGGKVLNYEEGIKKIAPFSSIESFWALWTHLSAPSTLQPTTDYILFHLDVKRPVWEDPLNKDGGKWIIRLRKGVADILWENLVLALIGDQFDEEDRVCGCVLSVRSQEDIISVWHQDEKDAVAKEHIRETIRRCLQLNPSTTLEYKTNNDSLHDKSSFRTQGVDRTAEKSNT